MEKTERPETHDFMNVESFSQLPFIRPAPVKEKAIRLFGKEFGGDNSASAADESVESVDDTTTNNNACEEVKDNNSSTTSADNGEISSRKFECHYCCRNFPTSQALGGHQNAHKRERQNAKRAHLQSAMVHGGLSPEAHVYGYMNYRFGSAPPPPPPPAAAAMAGYQSWSNTSSNPYNNRFYGGHHHVSSTNNYTGQAPINGSPLGLWRIPSSSVHSSQLNSTQLSYRPMHHPLPLFASDDLKPMTSLNSPNSQTRFGYESKSSLQDHVSLDLHL